MKNRKVLESAQPIDLLITDVGLPHGLKGRQLADMAILDRLVHNAHSLNFSGESMRKTRTKSVEKG